jgi:hypothetical protein
MPKTDNGGSNGSDDLTPDRETRWNRVVRRLYDPDRDGGLTTAIVFAVADAEGVAPTEVESPVLYDVIDVAGIEAAFFDARSDEPARETTGRAEFRYAGYLVEVASDGWVTVYEPNDPQPG